MTQKDTRYETIGAILRQKEDALFEMKKECGDVKSRHADQAVELETLRAELEETKRHRKTRLDGDNFEQVVRMHLSEYYEVVDTSSQRGTGACDLQVRNEPSLVDADQKLSPILLELKSVGMNTVSRVLPSRYVADARSKMDRYQATHGVEPYCLLVYEGMPLKKSDRHIYQDGVNPRLCICCLRREQGESSVEMYSVNRALRDVVWKASFDQWMRRAGTERSVVLDSADVSNLQRMFDRLVGMTSNLSGVVANVSLLLYTGQIGAEHCQELDRLYSSMSSGARNGLKLDRLFHDMKMSARSKKRQMDKSIGRVSPRRVAAKKSDIPSAELTRVQEMRQQVANATAKTVPALFQTSSSCRKRKLCKLEAHQRDEVGNSTRE